MIKKAKVEDDEYKTSTEEQTYYRYKLEVRKEKARTTANADITLPNISFTLVENLSKVMVIDCRL
jgi:hypothetical protein